MSRRLRLLALLLGFALTPALRAQETDGVLSEAEVESLRDAAPVPNLRLQAYEKILDDRQKAISDLLAKPRRPGFAEDMHDYLDQFARITDELNDNLDEFSRQHRDVRKALGKLLRDTDRWATVLRSPPEDDAYTIVKKIALDNLKDTHDLTAQLQADEEAYFKAHPEAAKAEKDRIARIEN